MGFSVLDDLVKQAEAKFRSGDLRGAYDDARLVLSQTRTNGRAHYLMSCIATLKGAHSDSLKLCQIAITLDGLSAEYLGQLATCHFHLGALVDAWTSAVGTLDHADVPSDALDKLSDIFHAVEDYPRYLEVALRKHALHPEDDAALVHLGAAYFLCGRIEDARKAVDAAIRLNPKNTRAYCVLTDLRPARLADNVVDIITSLIGEEKNTKELVVLYHALAREYDGMGQADRAFKSLKKGKAIFQSVTGYTLQPDIDMFAAINRYVDAPPPEPANASSAQPIFVVGMPRSGTTVTQRILTNCDGVVSIGESLQFGALVRTHSECSSPRLVEAQTVDRHWRGLPLDIIGEAYSAYGMAMARSAQRFVDKLPLNLLYAALIVRALPNARIICLRRHPLDTVLGNYRQLLGTQSPTYAYGCSLKATATFVAESMKLAEKLARHHPQQFHLVDYEELATNPAAAGREIVKFCGLQWNDDVVKIENNTSPVGTASAVQVQAPIHTRYVGRWRKYKDYLGEAIAVLNSYDISSDTGA
jgi:tetratricopeptide (TPR) repeat protein